MGINEFYLAIEKVRPEGKWMKLEIISEAIWALICVTWTLIYISIFRVKEVWTKLGNLEGAHETRKGKRLRKRLEKTVQQRRQDVLDTRGCGKSGEERCGAMGNPIKWTVYENSITTENLILKNIVKCLKMYLQTTFKKFKINLNKINLKIYVKCHGMTIHKRYIDYFFWLLKSLVFLSENNSTSTAMLWCLVIVLLLCAQCLVISVHCKWWYGGGEHCEWNQNSGIWLEFLWYWGILKSVFIFVYGLKF